MPPQTDLRACGDSWGLARQKRVFMYVQTQWSTTKGLDNQRILSKLPPALRGDILEAINDELVKLSPIFQKARRRHSAVYN